MNDQNGPSSYDWPCTFHFQTMPVPTDFPSNADSSEHAEDDMGTFDDVFTMEDTDSISCQIRDFGCHLDWTELRRVDGRKLEDARKVLRGETWDYHDRPTYFTSVRNLQGFIEYRLDDDEKAEEYFLEVLDHDSVNINALANMMYLLQRHHRVDERDEYKQKLRAIFSQTQDGSGYCPNYPQRARAYADRAHAIRYFEQDKRCFRYMIYAERAATLGKVCHVPERAEWFFDHALALYRRDEQMLYLRKVSGERFSDVMQRRIKSGFGKAVKLFHSVIEISESKAYLSLSWVFIGIMLNHDRENRTLSAMFPQNSELARMSAEDCYQRGLSIHGTHEITTRRVGAEYVKLKRYVEAKELLDRSICKLESWFAHRYRGVLYLTAFEDQSLTDEALKDQFGVVERRELLQMAKREFEEGQKERKVHADFSDLGQVYFHLGQHRRAIKNFRLACESEQDDYFDVLETYNRWIRCIGDGNPAQIASLQRQAEEHRQRLIDTPLDTNGDSFSDDFEHYSKEALPGHVRLLTEADFWVASATGMTTYEPEPPERPTQPGQYKYDFYLSYSDRDRIWSLALLNKLESVHGLRGCIEHRDFRLGEDRSVAIWDCLEQSHRFVVILSPHYTQDRESKAILRDAFEVAFQRTSGDGRYILPVVLTDCEVSSLHRRLKDKQKIICNMGQIREHDWQDLVSSVKQEAPET